MQSSVHPLVEGAIFADRLVRPGLSDLLLADPGPAVFFGFLN